MDESGLSTVPSKLKKVIGEKGRNVSKITSAERGVTVTVICCMSGGGHFVPPALIFPRKRHHDALLFDAPHGSIQMCSDSGFINTDLFLDWLKHFQKAVKSSAEDPVLLVLDNHSSHVSLSAVLFCREHSIHVVSLPPHSSHKTQPLDVCFYGPLKTHYASAAENWMAMHPGKAISQYQVAELLNIAYSRCATVGVACKAFAVTGIWPLNKCAFTAVDFVGSLVTDKPYQSLAAGGDQPSSAAASIDGGEVSVSVAVEGGGEISLLVEVDESSLPATVGSDGPLSNAVSNGNGRPTVTSSPSNATEPGNGDEPSSVEGLAVHVSPSAIRPFPKTGDTCKKRRKSMRSEIFTASPFKDKLTEKQKDDRRLHMADKQTENVSKNTRKVGNSKSKNMTKKQVDKKQIHHDSNRKRKLLANSQKQKKAKQAKKSCSADIFCPACEESYHEPPTEDWIQCQQCLKWWHESCTSYEGGAFVCDLC